MQIRAVQLTEAPAIAALHRRSRIAAMPWQANLHTPEEDLAFIRNQVLAKSDVFVMDDSSGIVGMVAWRTGWLDHLYVDPNRRGEAIGRHLLEIAKEKNQSLDLWVFQDNEAAIRFYQRNMFAEVARTDGCRNEEKMPDIRMAWKDKSQ